MGKHTDPIVLMSRRSRGKRLKGCRPCWAVMGCMRIPMAVRMRAGMWMSRWWWWPLIDVRIILIHNLGAAHYPQPPPRWGLTFFESTNIQENTHSKTHFLLAVLSAFTESRDFCLIIISMLRLANLFIVKLFSG